MSREQLKTVNAFILDTIDHTMARQLDGRIKPWERSTRRLIAFQMKHRLGKVAARLERRKPVKIRVKTLSDGSRYFTLGHSNIHYFVPNEAIDHNFPDDSPNGTAV